MTAPNGKAVAATAALSVAAFAFGNCYAACLLSLPGQPTSNLTAALAAMPAFATGAGILHAGTGPMATGLLAACAVWAAWARALTHGPGERAGEEHGSARWAKPREARRFADANDPRNNVILTRNISMALDQRAAELPERDRRNLNRVVVGGSGSGKTFFDAVPNLLQANENYIILDVKGELLYKYGLFLKSRGYTIRVLNLKEQDKSDAYNPFDYIENELDLIKLIANIQAACNPPDAVTSDSFWKEGASLTLLSEETGSPKSPNLSGRKYTENLVAGAGARDPVAHGGHGLQGPRRGTADPALGRRFGEAQLPLRRRAAAGHGARDGRHPLPQYVDGPDPAVGVADQGPV